MSKSHHAGAALAALLLAAGCAEPTDDSDDATTDESSQAYESPTADDTADARTGTTQPPTGEGGTRAPQTALTVSVAESDEFGEYLTDGQGRPLYMFTADTQGASGGDAQISCSGQCLDAWPLAVTAGAPKAEGGANPSLVGRMDHEGQTVVTYDGWPLYYFARDSAAGAPKGQEIESFGGTWRLVTPDGMKAGEEGESEDEGATDL